MLVGIFMLTQRQQVLTQERKDVEVKEEIKRGGRKINMENGALCARLC